MVETRRLVTADELAELPTGRGKVYELVDGELRTMAAGGFEHGLTIGRTTGILWGFISPRELGGLCGAETGFRVRRDPDTVRAPDVAFIARDRMPALGRHVSYEELVPDFVVEVVSLTDRWSELRAKVTDWLRYGCKIVWVLDPVSRTAEVWHAGGRIERRGPDDEIDAEPVLPGFSCRVGDLFP